MGMDEFGDSMDAVFDDFMDSLPPLGDMFNPWESADDSVIGTPEQDAGFWHQQGTNFTCAVVSQEMILNQFGIDVSESQLVYDATSNGWLTEQGTSTADFANLLESYGIDTHTNFNAGISDIMTELSQGHKVMVSVDSGEMWGQDSLFSDFFDGGMGADHALVITGVDVSDHDNPMVIVNDPGDPTGGGKAYPMDLFVDAWQDSSCLYVATNDAPPDIMSSPFGENFNPDTGMYCTPEFWSAIGGCVYEGLETGFAAGTAAFAATGSAEVAGIVGGVAAGIDTFVSSFDLMTDIQRNDLFLTV
jgi:hypothetical protein